MRKPLLALLTLVSALISARAFATPIPSGESPTVGVYNPTVGVSGDADASSMDRNPAQLGFLRSWSGVYLHSELDPSGIVGGRGDGFFFATPIPYLSSLSIGAGVQSIRPPSVFPYADEAKLSLAFAWRLVPSFSIGLNYSHLASDKGPVQIGIDTLDLALSVRLGRLFSGGLVVHDLPAPAVGGVPLQRVYEPEISVRPLGNQRLEIAAGARFGERRGDIDPHFRIWVSPAAGIWVKADIEWRRDVDLDGIDENDVRVGLGLQVDLEHLGFAGFGLFGRDEGNVRGHGFTLAARVSGERYPTVWKGPRHLEKLDISSKLSGRNLTHTLGRMRRLERESDVNGMVVVVGEVPGGWAVAEELRSAMLRLRRAGKHVYVYLSETDNRGYYVASAGERVFLDPAGGIRLTGLSQTVLFFKGTGDLLGVQADFVKIAEYKSAPEAYTRTESTGPARQQREAIRDDIYQNWVEGIASARHVTVDKVRAWVDAGPYTAQEAVDGGLVDELKYSDELEGAIGRALGQPVAIHDAPKSPERSGAWSKPKIAVVYIEGDIVDGKSREIPLLGMKLAGAETIVPAIIAARENDSIKAVVLRVSSPGGSALASDRIAHELELTRKIKPVICSMGDVAASGGYFVSAPCERIFAAPSTITGSIGIFSGKFDISGLAHKLGVSFEAYERGQHASIESMWRPYTDDERVLILQKLRYFYGRFVDAVARGRHMKADAVDAIARGHVWTGAAARVRGLVDEYGGIIDAIAEAKQRAGYEQDAAFDITELPKEPSLLGQLAGLFGIELSMKGGTMTQDGAMMQDGMTSKDSILPSMLQSLVGALPGSLIVEPSVPQTRLDESFDIK